MSEPEDGLPKTLDPGLTECGALSFNSRVALEAAFRRASVAGVTSNNLINTFAPRLLRRGAASSDVQNIR